MAEGADAERNPIVHPTAEVAENAALGAGTRIWHQAQVMPGARLGRDCTVGKGAFVGSGTVVGDLVKIGNYANLFGPRVEDEVFIGPMVCVMEDPSPRATTPDGARKGHADFERRPATIRRGATLGAGTLVLPGITIGRWAMVASGAVVNRDVADHSIVAGNPARAVGHACVCGGRLDEQGACGCGRRFDVSGPVVVAAHADVDPDPRPA